MICTTSPICGAASLLQDFFLKGATAPFIWQGHQFGNQTFDVEEIAAILLDDWHRVACAFVI